MEVVASSYCFNLGDSKFAWRYRKVNSASFKIECKEYTQKNDKQNNLRELREWMALFHKPSKIMLSHFILINNTQVCRTMEKITYLFTSRRQTTLNVHSTLVRKLLGSTYSAQVYNIMEKGYFLNFIHLYSRLQYYTKEKVGEGGTVLFLCFIPLLSLLLNKW